MATDFIVVGHGRSGSSLLAESLKLHPRIHCYGELFHNDPRHREAARGRVLADGEPADAFLRQVVFQRPAEFGKDLVGFKLFFFHGRGGPAARSLWDLLAARTDLRVIVIERLNLFDAYVSQLRAQATGRWRRRPDEAPEAPVPRLHISPPECGQYLRVVLAGMEMLRRHFERHTTHRVTYEALSRDYRGSMASCFEFLGVEPSEIEPPLARMNHQPHAITVENLDEVEEYFSNSEFAPFFSTTRPPPREQAGASDEVAELL